MYEKEDQIEEALKRMLDCSEPPTAILTTYDTAAEVIYLVLQRMGLRVPKDISLMGFVAGNAVEP